MRCPKCGYISFDHLEECLKCKKNIKEAAAKLQGSVYKVPAPVFLQIQSDSYEESGEPVDIFADDVVTEEEEFIDEDLEILVESPEDVAQEEELDFSMDDDEDITINLGDDDEPEGVAELEEEDEEDEGIEIDLSQFEDKSDPEMGFSAEESSGEMEDTLGIDIPDELADLSDLAPPDLEPEPLKDLDAAAPQETAEADHDEPALNLDDLDFDLGMDGVDSITLPEPGSEKVLSLDEIDFADALDSKPADRRKDGGLAMDDDLDFELDLGGLSIHDDDRNE